MSDSTQARRATAASVLLGPPTRVRRAVFGGAAGIALLLSGMVAIGNGWRYSVVVVPLLWLAAALTSVRLLRGAQIRLTPGAVGRRTGRAGRNGSWRMTGRSRVTALVDVPLGVRPDGSAAHTLVVLDDTGRRAAGARRDLLSVDDADELIAWAENTAGVALRSMEAREFVRTYPYAVPRWRRLPHAEAIASLLGLAALVVVVFLLGRWSGLS